MPIREDQLERSMQAAAPRVSTVGVLDLVAHKRARRRTVRRVEFAAIALALVAVLSTVVVLAREDGHVTRVAASGGATGVRVVPGGASVTPGSGAARAPVPITLDPDQGYVRGPLLGFRLHALARGLRPQRRHLHVSAFAHRARRHRNVPRGRAHRSQGRDPLDRRRRRRALGGDPQPTTGERAARRVPEAHRSGRRGGVEVAAPGQRPRRQRGSRRREACGSRCAMACCATTRPLGSSSRRPTSPRRHTRAVAATNGTVLVTDGEQLRTLAGADVLRGRRRRVPSG